MISSRGSRFWRLSLFTVRNAACTSLILISIFFVCNADKSSKKGPDMTMQVTSPAFKQSDMIPDRYTCKGEDLSPALRWAGVPSGTKSLALIFDDPDAPMGTWVHWIIYNIPADSAGLPENVPAANPVKGGGIQGANSWGRIGYGGPCPPSGTHRYFFRLYALDTMLDLKPGATKSQLLKTMEGHILAEGELMGRYQKR